MLMQAQVGPLSNKISDGTLPNLRLGNSGDLIVSEIQPRYYEAAYRGKTFVAANQTPAVTSVAFATTYTGLVISNPVGSGINVVLKKVAFATIVAFPAGSVIGLMTGYSVATFTHTTPVTPKNTLVGTGPSGLALVDAAATLPVTPTLHMVFASGLTGAITTEVTAGPNVIDLEGSVILPPGGFAAIYTSTASGAAALAASFMWDEVPI